jgi:hypothetical protein
MTQQSELNELKKTIEAIILVYKKRLGYLEDRRKILAELQSNHGDLLDTKLLGKQEKKLWWLVKRERGLLKVITAPEGVFNRESRIQFVYERFDRMIYLLQQGGDFGFKVDSGELLSLLKSIVIFVRRMELELKNIEQRMNLEEAYLHNMTQENFFKFFDEWERELSFNNLMVEDFKQILRQNANVIRKHPYLQAPATIASEILGLALQFVKLFTPCFKRQLADDQQTTNLISQIEEYRKYRGLRPDKGFRTPKVT